MIKGKPTYKKLFEHFSLHRYCSTRGGFPNGAKHQIRFLYGVLGLQMLVSGLKTKCAYDAIEQFAKTGSRFVSVCGIDTIVPLEITINDAKTFANFDKEAVIKMFEKKVLRSKFTITDIYTVRLEAIKEYNKEYNKILENAENLPKI
jgi:hypothetical protein